MIENEFKYLLDEKQYNSLLMRLEDKFCSSVNVCTQINYYYDTDDYELGKHGITLRVRQKEEGLQMQLKIPVKIEGNLAVKKEINMDIKDLPLIINTDNQWSAYMPYKGDTFLRGVLVTKRTKWNYKNLIEIDLDKNYYLGLIDYELEIEFEEGGKEEALALINDIGQGSIAVHAIRGKCERFFHTLRQKQGISNECI